MSEIHWEVLGQPDMIARLVLQVVLFALSALFSSSETALFSLRESDFDRLERKNEDSARRIRRLLSEPRKLIVSILCGNELINIAATVNLAGIFLPLFAGDAQTATIVNTFVMLPLILLLGEITPKTIAVSNPTGLTKSLVEPVITTWSVLITPFRALVRAISDRVTILLVGAAVERENILSADEFRTLLKDIEKEGKISIS